MGGLPQIPLASELVDVAGTDLSVRSLSRAEQLKLAKLTDDVDHAEILLIAWATGFSEDEVRTWREETPGGVVGALVDAIVELSGMREGAQKSGGASVPAG
jgi:hypothetical protein